MKKKAEKKIHMQQTIEKQFVIDKQTHQQKEIFVPMHYFYLRSGGEQMFLCKQRKHLGVARYFRQDLPVDIIYRHKWGRDKMLDKLISKLPKCLADAERYPAEYAI